MQLHYGLTYNFVKLNLPFSSPFFSVKVKEITSASDPNYSVKPQAVFRAPPFPMPSSLGSISSFHH